MANKLDLAKFAVFWKAYPYRMSKGRAKKAFAKISPDDKLLATMLTALAQAKKSKQWRKDDGDFIPYPASWLNAEGWEDEIAPPQRRESQEERLHREAKEARAKWAGEWSPT